jgi:hypothetical protein
MSIYLNEKCSRIMLAAATFLTNDPVKISCYLSLPLPYVSATIWNLDRNIHWMTEGYKDLARIVSADHVDEAQLSDVLHFAIEQFWEASQPGRIDLVRLWASISWATCDDLLPSPVVPSWAA